MGTALVYGAYAAAGAVALVVYCALPKEGRPARRGLTLLLGALAVGCLVMLLGQVLGERGAQLYFYVLSILAVGGAVRVVTHPRPVYSALYFVMVVLSTAALMVVVGAEFLAAALVIVYAGAILVTYVFVIMLAQQSEPAGGVLSSPASDYDRSAREPAAASLAGFVLIATVAGVIVGHGGPATSVLTETTPAVASAATEGNTLAVGRVLLTDFAVSVELAGVLLMVAMVGAIAIARRRIPQEDEGAEVRPPGEIGKHVEPF